MSSSAYPIIYSTKHAPVADAYERLILFALADHGDHDGANCYPAIPTMAAIAMCDEETVKLRLKRMLQRKIIRKQQGLAPQGWLKLRADRRPVVYEILIPFNWFSPAQREEINAMRAQRGLFGDDVNSAELTEAARPDIAPPARRGRKTRKDKGVPNPRRSPKKNARNAPSNTPSNTPSDAPSDGGVDGGANGGGNGGNEETHHGGGATTPREPHTPDHTPDAPNLTSENSDGGVSYAPPLDDGDGGCKRDGTGAVKEVNGGVSYSPNPPIDPLTNNPPFFSSQHGADGVDGGGGDGSLSDPAAPESDAPHGGGEGFTVESVRSCIKDGAKATDADLAMMARRAAEVVAWGFTVEEVCQLLGRAHKSYPSRDFLRCTQTPEEVRSGLGGGKDLPDAREDVERACRHLVDALERLGFGRPAITKEWRRAARLMIDEDYAPGLTSDGKIERKKIDLDAILRMVEWMAQDDFWGVKGNIQSMTKLRKQFSKMAADAREAHKRRTQGGERPLSSRERSRQTVENMLADPEAAERRYWERKRAREQAVREPSLEGADEDELDVTDQTVVGTTTTTAEVEAADADRQAKEQELANFVALSPTLAKTMEEDPYTRKEIRKSFGLEE